MKNKAMEYLSHDPLLHMDMLEAIRRGNAEIMYAASGGVLLKERYSGAYMLSSRDMVLGKKLIDSLQEPELIEVHQQEMALYAFKRHDFLDKLECFQAVYMKEQKPEITMGLEIRRPAPGEMEVIKENYNKISEEELSKVNELGNLYVGVKDKKMIGFVGSQLEGSIGLLEVFPEFRRCGYGMELEKHMICLMLDKGYVPFGQVASHNEKSLAMQKKLGLEISKDMLYWLIRY